jgi:hypothetical protein
VSRTAAVSVVIVPKPSPVFGSLLLNGNQLIMSGTGGSTSGAYYVLSSTNVARPLSQWTRLATNVFSGSGNFQFTNPMNAGAAQQYYRLQMP